MRSMLASVVRISILIDIRAVVILLVTTWASPICGEGFQSWGC